MFPQKGLRRDGGRNAAIAREAERQKLLAAELPAWQKALTDARAKIVIYDFLAALAAINAAQITEPSLVAAQDTERKKINWLIDWKKQLIADLSTGVNRTIITRPPAVEYEGVVRANESELVLRVPGIRGGEAPMKWTAMKPPELLMISTSLISDDPRYASRRWLAAIFALETGQPEARSLADKAAKAKPEYREELALFSAKQP